MRNSAAVAMLVPGMRMRSRAEHGTETGGRRTARRPRGPWRSPADGVRRPTAHVSGAAEGVDDGRGASTHPGIVSEASSPPTSDPHVPEAVSSPSGNPHYPLLDVLRAVAAITVVAFHATQFKGVGVLRDVGIHLDVGVTVFFVLTGFLLYRPMLSARAGAAPRTPTRVFYWRRFLRIAPAYWVALLVMAPIITYAGHGLANFTFTQVYDPNEILTGIPPAWTVCVEVSFYLLLPLYAWVASRIAGNSARRELLLIGLLAVLSVGFRLWVRRLDTNVSYLAPLPGTLGWFTVGMAIAVLTRHGDRTPLSRLAAHRFVCWGAAAVVYAVASFSHQSGIASTGLFVAYGLIAGLVVLPSAVPSPEGGRGRVFGALSWLGLISYGIYLYHYPLMRWYAEHVHVDGGAGYALVGVLALTSAIAAGAISYYVLEKQVLRFKRVDPLAWVPGR